MGNIDHLKQLSLDELREQYASYLQARGYSAGTIGTSRSTAFYIWRNMGYSAFWTAVEAEDNTTVKNMLYDILKRKNSSNVEGNVRDYINHLGMFRSFVFANKDVGKSSIPKEEHYRAVAVSSINDSSELQEEDVKRILNDYLVSNGWTTKVAWNHTPGVDIDAKKDVRHWLIEVKGPGSRPEMRENYFLSIIGETLKRMDDPNARYSIAFPNMVQYRRLWNQLPNLAKKRTTIDLLLVDKDGKIEELH